MGEAASRDELHAVFNGLREAMAADRSEWREQVLRFETRMDTRMDTITGLVAGAREKGVQGEAKIQHLEGSLKSIIDSYDRRFRDLLAQFEGHLKAHKEEFEEKLKTHKEEQALAATEVRTKQDRNWGWVMALIGAVALLLAQSFWTKVTTPTPTPPGAQDPVAKK